ncbi:MAG: GGDEF domain-containing protein [Sulfurimonas sp.]|nr:GGDEF domain-containing protein [Sulfurimonas sp.]
MSIYFLKKHTIPIMLISLVLGISYLSYYNYNVQKNLLLKQLHYNSLNITNSISSSIKRFDSVKSTMSIQKLIGNISFAFEIFEFRYLSPDGTIKNSMLKSEIGKILNTKSFKLMKNGKNSLNSFFFEVRNHVNVMSIYYPIYSESKLIGIIDLCIDISEYKIKKELKENSTNRQVDILNLLKSINGSIINSIAISTKTDINNFLYSYVTSTKNIIEISIVDKKNKIKASSNKTLIGKQLNKNNLLTPGLKTLNNQQTYLSITNFNDSDLKLMLLLDASTYVQLELKLLTTAISTSVMALLFAIITFRIMFYSVLEQSRQEKEHLEHLVNERTKKIELLSKTDSLTQLWSRSYLEKNLEQEFKRAKRYSTNMSIMILDLDHFKNINDSYGHMAGDEVLRQISQRIQKCQRETDFIGRYGGEEIVIILPETTLEASKLIANKILKIISIDPVKFESSNINVTTSIGISSLRKEHDDYKMIFAEADEALYLAKNLGRNRVEVFTIITQLFKSE